MRRARPGQAPSLHSPCSGQRAFDRVDWILTHIDAGKARLQGIVENLTHNRRLTKDTARRCYGKHGYGRYGYGERADGSHFLRRMWCEAAYDSGREVSQLGSCVGQKLAGNGVGLVGGA